MNFSQHSFFKFFLRISFILHFAFFHSFSFSNLLFVTCFLFNINGFSTNFFVNGGIIEGRILCDIFTSDEIIENVYS